MSIEERKGKHFIRDYELGPMPEYGNYPESLIRSFRVKQLIGSGASIPQVDVNMTVLEIAPGTNYPAHTHAWPEAYFVIEGSAECTWGDETFIAEPGTAMYGPPFTPHAMRVSGDKPCVAVVFGWAPDGTREVFNEQGRIIEPAG